LEYEPECPKAANPGAGARKNKTKTGMFTDPCPLQTPLQALTGLQPHNPVYSGARIPFSNSIDFEKIVIIFLIQAAVTMRTGFIESSRNYCKNSFRLMAES
jgi:hypothetical protein